MDRCATSCELADLLAHKVIGRQFGGELFREAAGQHERVGAVGQRVDQWVELGDGRARTAQEFGVLGVAETERLAGRERDRDAGDICDRERGFDARTPRLRAHPGTRTGHHGREVDMSAHQFGHRSHRVAGLPAVFDSGDETEMP